MRGAYLKHVVDGEHPPGSHGHVLLQRQPRVSHPLLHGQSVAEPLVAVVVDQAADHVVGARIQRGHHIVRLACQVDQVGLGQHLKGEKERESRRWQDL